MTRSSTATYVSCLANFQLIFNGFAQSTEFEIDREYVGRVVGSQGAGVNRLRDQLGVKVDVSDDVDEKEKETGKKKKAVQQKSRVKV